MKLIHIKNNAKRGRIIKSRFSIISYNILQYFPQIKTQFYARLLG